MERMLALARSVGAFARFRQPSDDGIAWPAAPLDIARKLCTEVRLRDDIPLHPRIMRCLLQLLCTLCVP
jgi:hypothetical protein